MMLWKNGADPTLLQILRCVSRTNLLEIPEALQVHAKEESANTQPDALKADEQEDRQTERDQAIEKFLSAPFSQVEPSTRYLSGHAHFDTHQGVKGLEFDRVMVIMDDSEARGFMFKYEGLIRGQVIRKQNG